jgi:hypothetical protein
MMTDEEEAYIAHVSLDIIQIINEYGIDGADMLLSSLPKQTQDYIVRSLVVSY